MLHFVFWGIIALFNTGIVDALLVALPAHSMRDNTDIWLVIWLVQAPFLFVASWIWRKLDAAN